MAHGLNSVLKRGGKSEGGKGGSVAGSRRIFAPQFKLQVLDSYRNDADCKGNQRATARKYGIHRRQIQKWLQVEGNLRNSVSKSPELALSRSRQRDDERAGALAPEEHPDIPTLSPAACSADSSNDASVTPPPAPMPPTTYLLLDYTTTAAAKPYEDPAAPIDLSLKKPTPAASGGPSTPVPHTRSPTPPAPPPPAEIWDLSTKRKLEEEDCPDVKQPPVKLFKPYLDDNDKPQHHSHPQQAPPAPHPCCGLPVDPDLIYYNNNNNHISAEYVHHPHHHHHHHHPPHEYSPPYPPPMATYPKLEPLNYYYHHPLKVRTDLFNQGDIYHFEEAAAAHALKQRQSYSLEFKLRAIDCYYSDATCRGNQRAVAMKLNIHRRQVQKWLKQEDELRQRDVSGKHLDVVR